MFSVSLLGLSSIRIRSCSHTNAYCLHNRWLRWLALSFSSTTIVFPIIYVQMKRLLLRINGEFINHCNENDSFWGFKRSWRRDCFLLLLIVILLCWVMGRFFQSLSLLILLHLCLFFFFFYRCFHRERKRN